MEPTLWSKPSDVPALAVPIWVRWADGEFMIVGLTAYGLETCRRCYAWAELATRDALVSIDRVRWVRPEKGVHL